GRYWILRNSWGTNWPNPADGGYFKFDYDTATGCDFLGYNIGYGHADYADIAVPTQADLAVDSIYFTDEAGNRITQANYLDRVNVTAVVENIGTEAAPPSYVKIHDDEKTLLEEHAPGLRPGETYTLYVYFNASGDADNKSRQTIYAYADSHNEMKEPNETNNHLTAVLDVILPDLTVESIGITDMSGTPIAQAEVGQQVNISPVVKNNGPGISPQSQSGSYLLLLKIDSRVIYSSKIPRLAPGERFSPTQYPPWSVTTSPWNHTITAIADWTNSLPEVDETNNLLSKSLITILPDLTISSTEIEDQRGNKIPIMIDQWGNKTASVYDGQQITISPVVKNIGLKDAPPSDLAIVSGSTSQTYGVPGLILGQSYAVPPYALKVTTATPWLSIQADSGWSIVEKDEMNNNFNVQFEVLPVRCGDTWCNGQETCKTCPQDCGACPSSPRPTRPTQVAYAGGSLSNQYLLAFGLVAVIALAVYALVKHETKR
ncbi:MAG: hypothetical protein NT157_00420, partial [Candidatus Micrarchaeota archaeon]|nr:hypothetical protein [Candidatus Micrarchaeota archaeon]